MYSVHRSASGRGNICLNCFELFCHSEKRRFITLHSIMVSSGTMPHSCISKLWWGLWHINDTIISQRGKMEYVHTYLSTCSSNSPRPEMSRVRRLGLDAEFWRKVFAWKLIRKKTSYNIRILYAIKTILQDSLKCYHSRNKIIFCLTKLFSM